LGICRISSKVYNYLISLNNSKWWPKARAKRTKLIAAFVMVENVNVGGEKEVQGVMSWVYCCDQVILQPCKINKVMWRLLYSMIYIIKMVPLDSSHFYEIEWYIICHEKKCLKLSHPCFSHIMCQEQCQAFSFFYI